jgi:PAS domain S-box-containing protein
MEKSSLIKLQHKEYQNKMIEEVQDYAILLLDKDGNILNWNRGAEKIKGYLEEEIIGKNFRIFYGKEDRANKLPEQLITEAGNSGKATHEGWRYKKNGDKFWGSIVITALHNEAGDVIGFTKVTRDLTERKLAEDKAKQRSQELEFRNRELEQFAYIASHDLQEPLRKIQVFSGLLEKNIDNKETALKFLDRIYSSARRMSTLIKDVLEYSQLAKSEEVKIPVDLNVILENVLEDFDLLLEERKAKVGYAPLPIINGIPIQLHQLFTNLLSNAIKFSGDDPVIQITQEPLPEVEIRNYPGLISNQKYVRILFKDNGIGFDPVHTEDIFKLFKRLQDSGSGSGTGIGLALCKKIVENHAGYISVTSHLNKGTTFYIMLPVN